MAHKRFTWNGLLNAWFAILIWGLWASALFEIGLPFFVERLGVSIFVLFGVMLLVSALIYLLLGGHLHGADFYRQHAAPLLAYGLYWLISWVGLLYSRDITSGFRDTLQYLWYTVLAFLTIGLLRGYSLRRNSQIWGWVGFTAFIVLLSFSLFSLFGYVPSATESASGLFSLSAFRDYNIFTLSLLLSTIILFLGWRGRRQAPRHWELALYLTLIVLGILLGVLSGSRRSVLMYGPLALAIPLLMLLWRHFFRVIIIVPVVVVLLLSVAFIIGNPNRITELQLPGVDSTSVAITVRRMERALELFRTGSVSSDSRTERWQAALTIANEYTPIEVLVGRGTRSYYAEPEFIREDGGQDYPHNFLLSALLEGGILKLTAILLFCFGWYWSIFKSLRTSRSFWYANFLITANLLFLLSVSISGSEFFNSKQFLVIVVAYAAFWND